MIVNISSTKHIKNLVETPLDNESIVQKLGVLNPEARKDFIDSIIKEKYPHLGYEGFKYDWDLWARPTQMPHPAINNWRIWAWNLGRGGGKTRTGAETVRRLVNEGKIKRIGLIGPTANSVIGVMLFGDSGLFNITPKWEGIHHTPTYRKITWKNGAVAEYFSAEEPDRLRGPQFDFIWADELVAWKDGVKAWDMAMFGLRLGQNPRAIITTTPGPVKFLRDILKEDDTYVYSGSSLENKANLPAHYFKHVIGKYANTTLGRQEIDAEILDDDKGCLWKREMFDREGMRTKDIPKDFKDIIVAIDPAMTSNNRSAETAFCVAGLGWDNKFYVLHIDSGKYSPDQWGNIALNLYDNFGASAIIAETNNGGDLVEVNIRRLRHFANIIKVTASRGKYVRAEPVAALYERGLVHHTELWAKAEDQMCDFDPVNNPNAMKDIVDAVVWGLDYLMKKQNNNTIFYPPMVGGIRKEIINFPSF